MMKREFEKLAGYEVSYKDYSSIIEPMYMAINLSKEEFIKVLDRKRFEVVPQSEEQAQLRERLRQEMQIVQEDIKYYTERKQYYESLLQQVTTADNTRIIKDTIAGYRSRLSALRRRKKKIKSILA